MKMWNRAVGAAALAVGVLGAPSIAQKLEPAPKTGGTGSGSGAYSAYAVAADHPLASAAGAEMLAKGGNAVDAAVAASFALSVVRPFSCGIGGGGFMVIAIPDGRGEIVTTIALDYRETCPAAAGQDYFEKLDGGERAKGEPPASERGGKAVATPGTVIGLTYALRKYGTLDRATVLGPAIRIAREGYEADAFHVRAAKELIEKFEAHPEFKTRYAFVWERLLDRGQIKEGDRVRLAEQADAFALIAETGAAAVTEGALGEAMVRGARGAGGEVARDDLRGFKVRELEPIRGEFLGRMVMTMPPPSSGGAALLQVMGMMERRGVERIVKEQRWAEYAQDVAESFKFAFADRARWMADPAFTEVPVTRLLSAEYLTQRAGQIDLTRTYSPEHYGEHEDAPKDGGTSHISVVDARGGAVACTETINLIGGSWVEAPPFGFLLNDQMDDFTTRRGEANAFGLWQSDKNLPEPGKRPLSSMTPTVVLGKDGRVEAVAGGSGGPRIITATAQSLLNVLARGMSATEGVARPRLHHQWMPNALEIEAGYPDRWEGLEVQMWMKKLHHQVVEPKDSAAVQMVVRTPRREGNGEAWVAACDPRKGGRPAGK